MLPGTESYVNTGVLMLWNGPSGNITHRLCRLGTLYNIHVPHNIAHHLPGMTVNMSTRVQQYCSEFPKPMLTTPKPKIIGKI
jgi:hypothetical protein